MKIEKTTTKCIQGLAIILMIFHHLIGFPERILEGITFQPWTVIGVPIAVKMAGMAKLCVSLFCVVTGYGLAQKENITFRYVLNKLKYLLCTYWICEMIYIFFYLLSGVNVTLISILTDALLITWNLNHAAWYMGFYVLAIFSMWILGKISRRHTCWVLIGVLICWLINWGTSENGISDIRIFHYIHYIPVVMLGYYMGRTKIADWFYEYMVCKPYGTVFSLVVIGLLFAARLVTGSTVFGISTIWIFSPVLFVLLAIVFEKVLGLRWLRRGLEFMGEYSTEFWLLNAIFTSGIFWVQYICFLPRYSLLITVWSIILMFPVAKGVRMITGWIASLS